MRLGVALPSTDGGRPLGAETLAEAAQRIEAAGFDSAWVFDSIGRGRLQPDPLTALAVAGTVTRRIELGTGVCRCRCAARWSWPIAS
jgi:alkanesulfonate monooxygenase SsuD/methylene tetrahydromethanopterin reductase-like flavin-dependent oxidoreductase (luciferase family)